MSTRRVAITGAGVVSPFGGGVSEFWSALSAGRHAFAPIEGIDLTRLRFSLGAQVRRWDPLAHFDPRDASLLDPFAQFAAVAAREAVASAGIVWTPALRQSSAIVTGSCVGGQSTKDEQFLALYANNSPRINPLTIPRIMENAGASRISLEHGVTGPVFTVSTACSSSNHAIGQAFWMVRSGAVELALAGGSEAVFSLGFLKAWEAMRVVSPDVCRPFSRDRRGLVLGEGAAILVLEPLGAARARGAEVLAEVCGFGMSSDAHHITQPSPAGAARAIRAALADASLPPESIGYINAHGTGTQANDPAETAAIRDVFGPHVSRLAVSSTKSSNIRGGRRANDARHSRDQENTFTDLARRSSTSSVHQARQHGDGQGRAASQNFTDSPLPS